MKEATQEAPLRRAEAMAREEHPTARIDAKPGDPYEEPLVRGGYEPALPANGESGEDEREEAHEHRHETIAAMRTRRPFLASASATIIGCAAPAGVPSPPPPGAPP